MTETSTVQKLYKATLPSINYIFKNGKPAIFVHGRFSSSVKAETDELDAEIEAGHPHIFIDKDEPTVDSRFVNPIDALKEKLREEIRAEMAAATNPANDLGNSVQEKLNVANSSNVAQAAQGGSGASLIAGLAKLTAAK